MKKLISCTLVTILLLLSSCSDNLSASSLPDIATTSSNSASNTSSASEHPSDDTSSVASDNPTLSPEGVYKVYKAENISFLDRTVNENGKSVILAGSPLSGFSYYSVCGNNSYVFHINGNLPVTDPDYHGTYRIERVDKQHIKREFYRGALNLQEINGKLYGIYLAEISCHIGDCYYAEFHPDGTHTKLLDISNVYFGSKCIYYYNYSADTLCTADFDGTNVRTLCKVGDNHYFEEIMVFEYGEYLLYYDDAKMMVIKPDGTHISLFGDKICMPLCGVRNGYVYAYKRDTDTNECTLWRVPIEGGTPEKLISTVVNDVYYCDYFFIDNWLYGVNGNTICVFDSQLKLESQYFFPEDMYIEQIDIWFDSIAISSDRISVYTRYGYKFIDMKTE